MRSYTFALLLALIGCGGDSTAVVAPATLVAASLQVQTAVVGSALSARPTVKVSGPDGAALARARVTFAVSSGGGSITGASQVTDQFGMATVGSWTVGVRTGTDTLVAIATDRSSLD